MTMDEFQLYHEQTFDSFSKRVIKNIAIDILREEARLAKRETSLSALSAQDAARLSAEDTYELDEEVSMSLGQHRTIAEASAVESPIRQETIGFPAHFFARAHNFKPPGRACQPEADSPMRT